MIKQNEPSTFNTDKRYQKPTSRSLYMAAVLFSAASNYVIAAPASYNVAIEANSPLSAGSAVTFGMAFAPGHMLYSDSLEATFTVGGQTAPATVQIDRKASSCQTRNGNNKLTSEFDSATNCAIADRYLQHAVITAEIPISLGSNNRGEIKFTRSASSNALSDTINLPADFSSRIEITLSDGKYIALIDGATINNAGSSLPQIGESGAAITEWLDGELAREWSVQIPFEKSGSGDHPHLIAQFGIRHLPGTNHTRLEAVIENTKTFTGGMKSHQYDVEVFVNNQLRYQQQNLTHLPHSRWRTAHWTNGYEHPHVVHTPTELLASGILPNYDRTLINNLTTTFEVKYDRLWSKSQPTTENGVLQYNNKIEYCFRNDNTQKSTDCGTAGALKVTANVLGPMGIGPLNRSMPTTGGRIEIGPVPQWVAGYALSQSKTMHDIMLEIASTSGSWPIHFRDENTGLPASIEDHPELQQFSKTLNEPGNVSTCEFGPECLLTYRPDTSHQPSLAYVPYMVSGESFYLEEVQFWAAFNAISGDSRYRGNERGLIESSTQIRGAAWEFRNLAQAAHATPDNHMLKTHFLNLLSNNIAEYSEIYLSDTSASPSYGAVVPSGYPVNSPWQDDYLTWAIGYTAGLGYESVEPFAQWKGNFPVQRMGYGTPSRNDYCYVFAAPYHLIMAPDGRIPTSTAADVATITVKKGPNSVPNDVVLFRDMASVFNLSNMATNGGFPMIKGGDIETYEACGSPAQFTEQELTQGRINGNAGFTDGYASQLGAALAVAVDYSTPSAIDAWALYAARADKPTFGDSPTWAIVPKTNRESAECRF